LFLDEAMVRAWVETSDEYDALVEGHIQTTHFAKLGRRLVGYRRRQFEVVLAATVGRLRKVFPAAPPQLYDVKQLNAHAGDVVHLIFRPWQPKPFDWGIERTSGTDAKLREETIWALHQLRSLASATRVEILTEDRIFICAPDTAPELLKEFCYHSDLKRGVTKMKASAWGLAIPDKVFQRTWRGMPAPTISAMHECALRYFSSSAELKALTTQMERAKRDRSDAMNVFATFRRIAREQSHR
jgi:hypothetical protein